MDAPTRNSMKGTLADNIEALRDRRRREERAAPLSDRVADRITGFTGSMTFVLIHILFFGGWILVNVGWVPGVAPFDPTFVVLAMEASVEAIFLSTFVLISQNRTAALADRRADLDLHIGLLAEHELSRLAALVSRIADRLEVPHSDPEFAEIERNVEPNTVLDALDDED